MSINLSYYLGKNKIDLKKFCIQVDCKSYDELRSYCILKNITCDISKEDYESFFPKEKIVQNEEKIIKKSKAKPRGRRKKQKAKIPGNSNTKDNP
mgnify:FL=1|tara:strand:+ start:117 stop:401 length:285 start_codon:yes stop_codon:yes gene_type:complete